MVKGILMLIIISCFTSSFSFAQSKKIAYTSNATSTGLLQIFTMNEDGSGKEQITHVDANCLYPKWSHDGTRIAFSTDDDRVFYISASGSAAESYVWKGDNPIFTNSDEEVIFTSDFDGVLSVYIMGLDEAEPFQISDGYYSNQMRLSADGSKMIYSSIREDGKVAMLLDMNDTTDAGPSVLSRIKDAALEPDIAPDNSTVTYAGFDNNLKGTIYVNTNGSDKAMTRDMSSANQPRFSPDGKKIGFAVIKGEENVDLYIMNTDGSSRQKLNIKGGNVGLFEWISDDRILYDAENGKDYSIGIVNINSGSADLLTTGGLNLHPDIQK